MKAVAEIAAIAVVASFFPLVRWWKRTPWLDCPEKQWRVGADGALHCGVGRHLTPVERLSLGQAVFVNELREADWVRLYGKKKGKKLARLEGRNACAKLRKLQNLLEKKEIDWIPRNLSCLPESGQ